MLTVLSQPDDRDWYALPPDGANYLDKLDIGVKGLRIAYAPTIAGAKVDDEVAALVAAAAKRFGELGAQVEEVDTGLPDSAAAALPSIGSPAPPTRSAPTRRNSAS